VKVAAGASQLGVGDDAGRGDRRGVALGAGPMRGALAADDGEGFGEDTGLGEGEERTAPESPGEADAAAVSGWAGPPLPDGAEATGAPHPTSAIARIVTAAPSARFAGRRGRHGRSPIGCLIS
jgi:hypothetical protein